MIPDVITKYRLRVALVVRNFLPVQETYEAGVRSLGQEYLLEEEMATTPVILPEKSHWQRSPVGYSPWDHRAGQD